LIEISRYHPSGTVSRQAETIRPPVVSVHRLAVNVYVVVRAQNRDSATALRGSLNTVPE
jgi:hypothetical protein